VVIIILGYPNLGSAMNTGSRHFSYHYFPGLSMTLAVFHDSPGLENGFSKFHDFP